MATIGTLTFSDDANTFSGALRTLNVRTPIRATPIDPSDNERAPTHRIVTPSGFELGAMWTKSKPDTGEIYYSLKLDAPEFNAPIYANLGRMPGTDASDGTFSIIWSRPN